MNNPEDTPSALSDADLEAVVGGYGNTMPLPDMTAHDMDFQAALKLVTEKRADMLDTYLSMQKETVERGQAHIVNLEEALGVANAVVATFGPDAKPESVFGANLTQEKRDELFASFRKEFGETNLSAPGGVLFDGQITKAEVDNLIHVTNSVLESEGYRMQMDELSLQSLSNKRDDAFNAVNALINKVTQSPPR